MRCIRPIALWNHLQSFPEVLVLSCGREMRGQIIMRTAGTYLNFVVVLELIGVEFVSDSGAGRVLLVDGRKVCPFNGCR